MNEVATKIYQQIPAIMEEIQAIGKGRKNTQQNYSFRGIDDVYNELHGLLAKHKVFTEPKVLEERSEERSSRSGGVLIYRVLKMQYRFFAEDGSSVTAVVMGEGMDSGDKASNKAMAVAHKYALLQMFAIPTEDDKDPENASPVVAKQHNKKVTTSKDGTSMTITATRESPENGSQSNSKPEVTIGDLKKRAERGIAKLYELTKDDKVKAEQETYLEEIWDKKEELNIFIRSLAKKVKEHPVQGELTA